MNTRNSRVGFSNTRYHGFRHEIKNVDVYTGNDSTILDRRRGEQIRSVEPGERRGRRVLSRVELFNRLSGCYNIIMCIRIYDSVNSSFAKIPARYRFR